MKEHLMHLGASKQEQKLYNYTAVYNPNDVTNDKKSLRIKDKPVTMVYRVEVWSDNIANALNKGMEIVNLQRAEEMTDYVTTHPRLRNVDSVTIDELHKIRDEAIDIGLFTDWMIMTPTSIQINLADDEELLQSQVLENAMHSVANIGDEVDDYLKEITDDA